MRLTLIIWVFEVHSSTLSYLRFILFNIHMPIDASESNLEVVSCLHPADSIMHADWNSQGWKIQSDMAKVSIATHLCCYHCLLD